MGPARKQCLPHGFGVGQHARGQWLGYLATEAMDSAVYYATTPFLFHMTKHMTDDHHTSTSITNYGVLLGCIALGRLLGREYFILPEDPAYLPFLSFLMTILLLLICFSNNYIMVIMFFLCKESISSFIGGMHANANGSNRGMTAFYARSLGEMGTSMVMTFSSDNALKRNLAISIFAVLLSSALYNESDNVRFPSFFPIVMMAILWDVIVFIYSLYCLGIFTNRNSKDSSIVSRIIGSGGSNTGTAQRQTNRSKEALQQILQNAPPTPQNFLDVCRGNEPKARAMFLKSLEWRFEYDVDNLLTTPQNHFHDIMKFWPHGIHGRSRDNCVVLYEILGRAKPRDLVNAGITLHDLIWHFNLRNEFVFQKVLVEEPSNGINGSGQAPSSSARNRGTAASNTNPSQYEPKPVWGHIMTVVDVHGISFRDLSTDVISFIKQNSDIIDNYYPNRVKRLVICNAPSWFSSVWGVVTAVLPQAVRDKIKILYGYEGLDEIIDTSQRPIEYGGRSGTLGSSPEHLQFLQLASDWEKYKAPSGTESSTIPSHSIASKDVNSTNGMNSRGHKHVNTSNGVNQNAKTSFLSRFWKAQPSPTQAFLGKRNSYKYDEELKAWTLDADDNETNGSDHSDDHDEHDSDEDIELNSPDRGSFISPSQLEEHGLVLAIHAAHLASQSRSSNIVSNLSQSASLVNITGGQDASHDESYADQMTSSTDSQYNSNSISNMTGSNNMMHGTTLNTQSNGNNFKLSPEIFLLSLGIYTSSSFLYVGSLAILPIWMMLPRTVGGLGYTVVDIGLVVSSSAMILLLIDTYFRERLLFIFKSSPLRMMRIATSIMAVTSILLPLLLGSSAAGTDIIIEDKSFHGIQPAIAAEEVLNANQVTGIMGMAQRSLFYGPLMSSHTPRESIVYLMTPSILLSLFVCSAYIGKKSSTMLLQVALSPAFASPADVVKVLGTCIDITGPALCCLIYRAVYDYTLHHRDFHGHLLPNPLNTSSFFSISLTLSSLLYCTTFLLNLQFRGDFGVMPDHIDEYLSRRSSSNNNLQSGAFSELLDIISEDLRLLFSPPKYGYGSKLYNLKIDLKDL